MNKQELMLSQIEMFEKKKGIKFEVKDGKLYYKGTLCCNCDYLPYNLVVDGGLRCFKGSEKLPKGLKIKKWLDVSETDITEIPDDCEFGSLDMSKTKITNLRDNLELDELLVYNSSLQSLPKGLKVKGALSISNTDIAEIPDDCEFGSLFMPHTKITKLKDNLVLVSLNACGSSLKQLPKDLKVTVCLDISNTNIYEIPDNLVLNKLNITNTRLEKIPNNLVVYGSLIMDKTPITIIPNDCLATRICCDFELKDERYEKDCGCYKLKDEIVHIIHPSGKEFLHVDGILSEVIEKKGNVYHVRNGVNKPNTYVVTDGNNHWAHGETLEDAKEDLHFKINKRDKSEYESLTLDSELNYDEAVVCYRVITGACRAGTQDYLEHHLPEPRKDKYTIREMIELTKNGYGSQTFKEFFVTE